MNTNKSPRGIGFTGALTISFVVLKLCGVIDWSWWWVFSPAWILFSVILLLAIVFAIFDHED